jgi:hypothetical protein
MVNRDPALCRSFVKQAKSALANHPQIKHEWSIDEDEDHCILDIPEQCENGFAITVEVWPTEIMIVGSGAHTQMYLEKYNGADELAAYALGLVRDLLSPAMRILERSAGGEPYKWAFQSYHDGAWRTEELIGLLFWNYFGKRSERIYQNTILPARTSIDH